MEPELLVLVVVGTGDAQKPGQSGGFSLPVATTAFDRRRA
jgi:hypothetical protein